MAIQYPKRNNGFRWRLLAIGSGGVGFAPSSCYHSGVFGILKAAFGIVRERHGYRLETQLMVCHKLCPHDTGLLPGYVHSFATISVVSIYFRSVHATRI